MPPTAPSGFRRWFNLASHSDTLLRVYCQPRPTTHEARASSTAKRIKLATHQPGTGPDQSSFDAGSGSISGSANFQGEGTSQQPVRTYHAHAVVLRAQSEFFDISLDKDWQHQHQQHQHQHQHQQQAEPGSAPHAPMFVVDLQMQPDELEALDLLLRYTYGFDLPPVSPETTSLLIQCLLLADRFHVPHCVDALLDTFQAAAVSSEVLQFLTTAPPGITNLPTFQALSGHCTTAAQKIISQPTTASDAALLSTCKRFIINTYSDVPAVIRSEKLRQEFCTLPFDAVLAWAESDELRVHSENCVVYLLSTWVKAARVRYDSGDTDGSEDDSEDDDDDDDDDESDDEYRQPNRPNRPVYRVGQLEQLAQQVRVLHLGPAYQHHILPQLGWFVGCCCAAHLPTLLAYKGKDTAGNPVFPAVSSHFHAQSPAGIPMQWVAGARQLIRVSNADQRLSWEVGGEQLLKLRRGDCISSPPLYLNGFMLRMQAQCRTADDGAKTLSLFAGVDPVQAHGAIPWPDEAVVTFGGMLLRVLHGADAEVSRRLSASFRQGDVSRDYELLSKSVPSMSALLAPYLKDGKLHVQAKFTTVDRV